MSPIIISVVIFVLVFIVLPGLYTVPQNYIGLVERFGKYNRQVSSGLHFKIPFIESVNRVSMKIRELNAKIESKTKDNVTVTILVATQFNIITEKVVDAFYKLANPLAQIESYIFDVVRAKIPKMSFDQVFEEKDSIALDVQEVLRDTMSDYGFNIQNVLVNGIDMDAKIRDAMNEINASRRLKEAQIENAEAEKLTKIKLAEADAEEKRLSGVGIAEQRKAIIEGLRESVEDLKKALTEADGREIMNIIMQTQYFDTLKDISAHSTTNTIMVNHNPSEVKSSRKSITDAIVEGNLMTDSSRK